MPPPFSLISVAVWLAWALSVVKADDQRIDESAYIKVVGPDTTSGASRHPGCRNIDPIYIDGPFTHSAFIRQGSMVMVGDTNATYHESSKLIIKNSWKDAHPFSLSVNGEQEVILKGSSRRYSWDPDFNCGYKVEVVAGKLLGVDGSGKVDDAAILRLRPNITEKLYNKDFRTRAVIMAGTSVVSGHGLGTYDTDGRFISVPLDDSDRPDAFYKLVPDDKDGYVFNLIYGDPETHRVTTDAAPMQVVVGSLMGVKPQNGQRRNLRGR